MTRKVQGFAGFFVLALMATAVLVGEPFAQAAPVNVIHNAWALGIDNDSGCPGDINSGWQHNENITLSRCTKNPAPPDGTGQGGAAFKCGPFNGLCDHGELGESWQEFNAQDRGVAASSTYTATYSHLQVCVGCVYVKAELLGSDDNGASWDNLGTLLDYDAGDPACDNSTFWATFCGLPLVVPHYDLYRLYIHGVNSGQLGYKFTGVELLMEPAGEPPTPTPTEVPTETPTPTATAVPTETPTPSATPEPTHTPQPLSIEPGAYLILCSGNVSLSGNILICE